MVKKSLFRGKKAYATVSPVLEIATLKYTPTEVFKNKRLKKVQNVLSN